MRRLTQRVAEWCRTHDDPVTLVFDGPVGDDTVRLAGGNLRIEVATAPRHAMRPTICIVELRRRIDRQPRGDRRPVASDSASIDACGDRVELIGVGRFRELSATEPLRLSGDGKRTWNRTSPTKCCSRSISSSSRRSWTAARSVSSARWRSFRRHVAPRRRRPVRRPRSWDRRCRCGRTPTRARSSPTNQSRRFQPIVVGSSPGSRATHGGVSRLGSTSPEATNAGPCRSTTSTASAAAIALRDDGLASIRSTTGCRPAVAGPKRPQVGVDDHRWPRPWLGSASSDHARRSSSTTVPSGTVR